MKLQRVCGILLAGLAVGWIPAQASTTSTGAEAGSGRSLVLVSSPDLDRMEVAVRQQIESAQREVEENLERPETSDWELSDSFGRLGQLYSLYRLWEAAEVAFSNACELVLDDFRWHYYLGWVHDETGRPEEAIHEFRRAHELSPGDVPTHLRLARSLLTLNRPVEAEIHFARAVDLAPQSAAAHYGLGRIDYDAGRLEEARSHLETALRLRPEASAAHYLLGLTLRDLGERELARQHLARGGQGPVPFPDPLIDNLGTLVAGTNLLLLRGSQAVGRGDVETAIDLYRRALESDPESLAARRSMASALARRGDLSAAVRELEEILRREPDDAVAHYNLGTHLAAVGSTEEALEHLRQAIQAAPDYADAHFNLGLVLEESGQLEVALFHYGRVLQLQVNDVLARIRQAVVLGRLGRPAEAETKLLAVLEMQPDNTEALLELGSIEESRGSIEEAEQRYREVLAVPGRTAAQATAHVRLAALAERRGDLDEAITQLRAASRLVSQGKEVRQILAQTLGRRGRYAEAADVLAELVLLDPGDENSRLGRAIALLLAEDYSSARSHLEQSLSLVPESLVLSHVLARLLATCPDDRIRDGQRALTLARPVFEARRTLDHAETVAMAYAELGMFEEALRWQEQVLEVARAGGAPEILRRLTARRDAYQRGEPCRAPWLETN